MNFFEYQKKAMRTANMGLSDNDQLLNAALGVSGEAGEFSGYVKKFFYQGEDLPKEQLISELGDVMWYIALACEAMGVDLEDVATYNLEKLEIRYPDAFSPHHSINRVPEFGSDAKP
jgi:NTP pyrophosphatase (non-canonical NTP hydrolase)